MIPFVIVADLRTGSTLLSTSLDRHPQVRCYGELFHPRDLPDNRIPGRDRYQASGEQVIERVLSVRGVQATGFRAMVFLPLENQPQWADAWESLRRIDGLRVIYLTRRDRLAQYASARIAHRTGAYHPAPGDPVLEPENRPTLRVDPEQFREWTRTRDELYRQRRELLRDKPSLHMTYEALVDDWEAETRRVQEFLQVDPVDLAPAKQKQERRPLSEVITNYAELTLDDTRGGVEWS